MSDAITMTISIDCSPVLDPAEELLLLLERFPKHVADALVQRALDLLDLGFETESVPAAATGSCVLRLRSLALAELVGTARRALDGGCPQVVGGHVCAPKGPCCGDADCALRGVGARLTVQSAERGHSCVM